MDNEKEMQLGNERLNVQCNEVFHPWRRYFARMIDILLYSTLWSVVLGLVFHVNLLKRGNLGNIIDNFVAIGIMLFCEPILLHLFKTTLGKSIFGLQVVSSDGRRLSYGEGLERTWRIIGEGMGYSLPIYNLVRLWKSYVLCSEKQMQPWDEDITYTIKDTKWYRGVFYIILHIVFITIFVSTIFYQKLPPNRGDLTVAEFVENFNYYASLYDIDLGSEYLDDSSKWVEKPFDGTVYVLSGLSIPPEFIYTLEEDKIQGVSFIIELENNQEWIQSNDMYILLASYAFAGAQEEVGLFSKVLQRVANQIQENTFGDYSFNEGNVDIICNTEYYGYTNSQVGFLIPNENEVNNYFRLEFSMKKRR